MKKLGLLCFLIVVSQFYILNDTIPMLYDDLPYAYYYPDHVSEDYSYRYEREMVSAWEIIPSQINHYMLHGGRIIVHGLVQLFCYGEHKTAYNIFATILFAIFVPLFGKICFPKERIVSSLGLALSVTFCLLFYVDSPNVLYHGIAFGINYLYSITMWFLYLYLLCYYEGSKGVLFKLFLVIMAVLAGLSHEGFSAGFCAAIVVWAWMNRNRLNRCQLISISLCCISAIIMVIAPGNFHRAEGDAGSNHLILILPSILNYSFFFIIGVLSVIRWKFKKEFDRFIKDNIPLLGGWFTSVLLLSYIGIAGGRAAMGFQLITFVLIIRLIVSIGARSLLVKISPVLSLLLVVLLGATIHYQSHAGKEYTELYSSCESNQDTIVYCFADSEIPIIIKPFVCQHTFEDRYWDARYSLKYKKPIYVCDAPVVNFDYSDNNREPGESPFYRLKDYLICRERLPEYVSIRLHQGNYQKWDMPTLARRVYFTFKHKNVEPLDVVLPSDSICIGADKYVYYINLPLDESARCITGVDYPIDK